MLVILPLGYFLVFSRFSFWFIGSLGITLDHCGSVSRISGWFDAYTRRLLWVTARSIQNHHTAIQRSLDSCFHVGSLRISFADLGAERSVPERVGRISFQDHNGSLPGSRRSFAWKRTELTKKRRVGKIFCQVKKNQETYTAKKQSRKASNSGLGRKIAKRENEPNKQNKKNRQNRKDKTRNKRKPETNKTRKPETRPTRTKQTKTRKPEQTRNQKQDRRPTGKRDKRKPENRDRPETSQNRQKNRTNEKQETDEPPAQKPDQKNKKNRRKDHQIKLA